MTPKHSNLGPSSADRWTNCPGSVAATALLPSLPTTRAAAEGTVAHSLAEDVVTGEMSLTRLDNLLGDIIVQDGFSILIDEEMILAVKLYADTIRRAANRLGMEHPDAIYTGQAEKRVTVSSISKDLYGTADYVLYVTGRVLRIYDFKYGKKAVNPEENKQLAIYILGVLDELGIDDWDEMELVIVQPRAGGKAIRRWQIPPLWLASFREELALAVKETQRPDARLKAGAWCWWCAAAINCPEKQKDRVKSAAADFPDFVGAT